MIGDVKHTYFYMAYNVNWDLKQSHKIVKFANDIVISNLFFTYGLTNLKKNKKKKTETEKDATCHYNNKINGIVIQQVDTDMYIKAHYIKEFFA